MLHSTLIGNRSATSGFSTLNWPLDGIKGLISPFSRDVHLALWGTSALFLMIIPCPSWAARTCGMNRQHGWSISTSGLAGLAEAAGMSFLSNGGRSRNFGPPALGSGASQTTTFLIPLVLALTTQSSVLKSLSLAQTSSSLVGLISLRAGGGPLASSQTKRPLTVVRSWAFVDTDGIRPTRARANSLRMDRDSLGCSA